MSDVATAALTVPAAPASAPTSPKTKASGSPQRKALAPRKAKELKPPSPKKAKIPKVKAAKTKMPANHPLYIDMVKKAIKENKDRKGTSRQTINKYVAQNYQLGSNTVLINHGITRAIKRALEKKIITQAAGSGARGRFRMVEKDGAVAPVKKTVKKAPSTKTAVKKTVKPKKESTKPAGEKKVKKAGRPKSTAPKAAKIPKVADPSKPKKKAGRPPKTPKE